MHVVLTCGGQGSRFAGSIGAPTPFPKHLQMLGNKPILGWAVDGAVKTLQPTGITFTINRELAALYVPYLVELQKQYPEIAFSYTLDNPYGDYDGSFERLKDTLLHRIYTFEGQKTYLTSDIIAVGFGDNVLYGKHMENLRQVVDINELRVGKNVLIQSGNNHEEPSSLYQIGRLDFLNTARPGLDIFFDARNMGIQLWNINDITTLQRAEVDIARIDAEGNPRNPQERK